MEIKGHVSRSWAAVGIRRGDPDWMQWLNTFMDWHGGQGTFGDMPAWIPVEFARDVFATMPCNDGTGYLCASLLPEDGTAGPKLGLKPGQPANYVLHVSVGHGSRNDALRETYRRRGGYRVNPAAYDRSEYNDPTPSR